MDLKIPQCHVTHLHKKSWYALFVAVKNFHCNKSRNIVICHSLPSYITLTNLSSAIIGKKSSFKSIQGDTVPAKLDSTVAVTHFIVNDAYTVTLQKASQYLHVLYSQSEFHIELAHKCTWL